MIEFSKESEMVPMGTSRKSGDLTWNDPPWLSIISLDLAFEKMKNGIKESKQEDIEKQ